MQGKPSVFCSPRLAFALERLSKGTLMDLVYDLARATLGENCTDEEAAEWITAVVEPVLREREMKPIDLVKEMGKYRG